MTNARTAIAHLLEDDPIPAALNPADRFDLRKFISVSNAPTQGGSVRDYYLRLVSKLNGRARRKVGNNTYLIRYEPSSNIAVRLHGTDIITVTRDNRIRVRTNGWETVTTRDRLNSWLPGGWKIYQKKHVWYWYNHSNAASQRTKIPFTDGDEILPSGELLPRASLTEHRKPAPNWAGANGIYANLSDWPNAVEYYVKCPKCSQVHGSYKDMREAHANRLCSLCNLEAIEKLKNYIKHVDDPDQKGKPGKSIAKIFGESCLKSITENEPVKDPDAGFNARTFITNTLTSNWIWLAIHNLSLKLGEKAEPLEDIPDAEDAESLITVPVQVGSEDWTIYKSEDAAYTTAVQQTEQEIESDPELFNIDFLLRHIDTEALAKDYMPDYYEEFREMFKWEDDQVDELIKRGLLDEEEFFTPKTNQRRKISPKRQRLIDAAIDSWVEKRQEDFDVVEYFKEIYGRDYAEEIVKAGKLDTQAAAEDAVDTDGWEHFLARYDGNSIFLPGGAVAVRTN